MSKNQEYIQQYAEYAMEQMRRYGIPASVTLHRVSVKVPVARVNCPVRETTILGSKLPPSGLRMEANILYIPMTVQTKSFASMRMWEIPMSIILSS